MYPCFSKGRTEGTPARLRHGDAVLRPQHRTGLPAAGSVAIGNLMAKVVPAGIVA
jgi:hypothetical protein